MGPYSDLLRHLLNGLDGSYLHCDKRLSDAGPSDTTNGSTVALEIEHAGFAPIAVQETGIGGLAHLASPA